MALGQAPRPTDLSLPKIYDSPFIGARRVRVVSNPAGTIVPIYSGQCILVGVLVVAGAAATTLIAYDVAYGSGTPPDNSTLVPANEVNRAKSVGGSYNGFVNFPIAVNNGLVASLDQTDAIAFVYYYPISTVPRGG